MRHKDKKNIYKHKSDFSWNKKNNPFKNEEPKKNFPIVKLFFGIVLNLTTLGILSFHPFFTLSIVSINGLERSDLSQVTLFTKEFLNEKRWFLFPQGSYFFLSTNDLTVLLKEKFPFDSVSIIKNFPNELTLQISEKIQYIIIDNEAQYILVDTEGNTHEIIRNVGENEWKETREVYKEILDESVTSTSEFLQENETSTSTSTSREIITRYHIPDFLSIRTKYPRYPLILMDHKEFSSEEAKNYISSHANNFIYMHESFHEYTGGDSIDYIEIETPYDVILHGRNGLTYKIGTKKNDEIIKQLKLIQYVYEAGESVHEYIDVRYENRAYWK